MKPKKRPARRPRGSWAPQDSAAEEIIPGFTKNVPEDERRRLWYTTVSSDIIGPPGHRRSDRWKQDISTVQTMLKLREACFGPRGEYMGAPQQQQQPQPQAQQMGGGNRGGSHSLHAVTKSGGPPPHHGNPIPSVHYYRHQQGPRNVSGYPQVPPPRTAPPSAMEGLSSGGGAGEIDSRLPRSRRPQTSSDRRISAVPPPHHHHHLPGGGRPQTRGGALERLQITNAGPSSAVAVSGRARQQGRHERVEGEGERLQPGCLTELPVPSSRAERSSRRATEREIVEIRRLAEENRRLREALTSHVHFQREQLLQESEGERERGRPRSSRRRSRSASESRRRDRRQGEDAWGGCGGDPLASQRSWAPSPRSACSDSAAIRELPGAGRRRASPSPSQRHHSSGLFRSPSVGSLREMPRQSGIPVTLRRCASAPQRGRDGRLVQRERRRGRARGGRKDDSREMEEEDDEGGDLDFFSDTDSVCSSLSSRSCRSVSRHREQFSLHCPAPEDFRDDVCKGEEFRVGGEAGGMAGCMTKENESVAARGEGEDMTSNPNLPTEGAVAAAKDHSGESWIEAALTARNKDPRKKRDPHWYLLPKQPTTFYASPKVGTRVAYRPGDTRLVKQFISGACHFVPLGPPSDVFALQRPQPTLTDLLNGTMNAERRMSQEHLSHERQNQNQSDNRHPHSRPSVVGLSPFGSANRRPRPESSRFVHQGDRSPEASASAVTGRSTAEQGVPFVGQSVSKETFVPLQGRTKRVPAFQEEGAPPTAGRQKFEDPAVKHAKMKRTRIANILTWNPRSGQKPKLSPVALLEAQLLQPCPVFSDGLDGGGEASLRPSLSPYASSGVNAWAMPSRGVQGAMPSCRCERGRLESTRRSWTNRRPLTGTFSLSHPQLAASPSAPSFNFNTDQGQSQGLQWQRSPGLN